MASPPTDSVAPDALLVINRHTDERRLADHCRQQGHQQALVLSPHRLFPSERLALAGRLAPTRVNFLSFADVLDDETMAAIDEATTRELLARSEEAAGYVRTFHARMTFRKNAAVHQRVPGAAAARLYADDGLGVSWDYWRQQGAVPLSFRSFRTRLSRQPWAEAWSRWRRSRRMPETGTWLVDGKTTYLLAGGVRRLPLRAGVESKNIAFTRSHAARADFIAATIHDHWPALHALGRPVRIFTDGFLPSNYPRTYLDGYGPAEFVATDPFSGQWLQTHGRTVVPPPGFIAPPTWQPLPAPPVIRTVVCLLNHAGDWSALVNRSDTDTLAATFLDLAAATPGIDFVLRPHPGMEHADHEGAGGIHRLAGLVHGSGLRNLTCSTGPLVADLTRGDLFVSEYSATLLDAWRTGKPGIILNVTGRRSFMDDFARLGFPSADSPAEFSAILANLRAGAEEFWHRHNAAVERYNAQLQAHLAR